jgi:predicted enzyme related to lactoylglutathione lyase
MFLIASHSICCGGVFLARIVHFDLQATDPEKIIPFYEKVFGWKFNKCPEEVCPPGQEYWLIETGPKEEPGIDGGLSKKGAGPAANTIGVENLDQAIEKVKAEGGEITMPKSPIPGVGWLAFFKDPDGNFFGMMQDDKEAK